MNCCTQFSIYRFLFVQIANALYNVVIMRLQLKLYSCRFDLYFPSTINQ